MTKQHTHDFYLDGRQRVEFCKVCGAEGLQLLDDCPRKIINKDEKELDDKKQSS